MIKTLTYLTKEQMDLVLDIYNNHEIEFRSWMIDNELELMKWFDENDYQHADIFESSMKFAYHCGKKFMDWKLSRTNVEV